jgi:hypothetical protein
MGCSRITAIPPGTKELMGRLSTSIASKAEQNIVVHKKKLVNERVTENFMILFRFLCLVFTEIFIKAINKPILSV